VASVHIETVTGEPRKYDLVVLLALSGPRRGHQGVREHHPSQDSGYQALRPRPGVRI
jgi:hypothetical protein